MKNLKQIRQSLGLSVRQVAEQTKLSPTFINRCESGSKVSSEKLEIYAGWLGCAMVPVERKKSFVVTKESTHIRIDFAGGYRLEIYPDRVVHYLVGMVVKIDVVQDDWMGYVMDVFNQINN